MKITEATWEKRNFGYSFVEIEQIDNCSDIDEIELLKNKFPYILIRIEPQNLMYISALEKKNFTFIETRLAISFPVKELVYPPMFKRIISKFDVQDKIVTNNKSLTSIKGKMKNMFLTDRISVDPYLGKDYSLKRYQNWLDDLFTNPSCKVFELVLKKEPIGFYALRIKHKFVDSVMGGIYEKFAGAGLGLFVIKNPLDRCFNEGFQRVDTAISTNNSQIVNMYASLPHNITKTEYTFRWINKDIFKSEK